MSRLQAYKGRTLEAGTPVKVYRNLHNQTFSIVDVATGLVVAHSEVVNLKDAKFVVSEAGRQRVLREKQKNVHAYVVGTFVSTHRESRRHEATYNPYKYETFVTSTQEPLHEAAAVTLKDGKVYYTGRV